MSKGTEQLRPLQRRIAQCAQRVQDAVSQDATTNDLSGRIAASVDADGTQASHTVEYTAAVRGYIENVPAMLQDRLDAAQARGAAGQPIDALVGLLGAALDAFESSPVVADDLGLVGLLDNAYLVYQLLSASAEAGDAHQIATELLGPSFVADLDARVAASRTSLGVPDTSPGTPRPGRAGAHGPCPECAHVRNGTAIARTAFDLVLEALKPAVRSTFSQMMRVEQDVAGQAINEQQSLVRSGQLTYSRRPTDSRLIYCGVEEFSGRYFSCEVKNGPNEKCEQFAARTDGPVRACATCSQNERVPSSVLLTVEAIAGRDPKGQAIKQEIRQTLQTQAGSEYEDCVQQVGIVSQRPGTLSICHAWSRSDAGEEQYVVGPILNVGQQCEHWSAGENEDSRRVADQLARLVADAKQALAAYTDPPIMDGDNVGLYVDQFKADAANAEADVIEHGLTALGVDPSYVESVCARYMSEVWSVTDRTDRDARTRAAAAAGYRQKNVPFSLERHKTYRHPDQPALTVALGFMVGTIEVRGERLALSNFAPERWIQVSPQPVAVRLSSPRPGSVSLSAMWLPPGGSLASPSTAGHAAPPSDAETNVDETTEDTTEDTTDRPAQSAEAEQDEIDRLNYVMRTQQELVEALWWVFDPENVPKARFAFIVSVLYSDPEVTRLEWIRPLMGIHQIASRMKPKPAADLREMYRGRIMGEIQSNPRLQPLLDLLGDAT